MKKLSIIFILLFSVILGLSASDIRFNARRPALINVPDYIKSVAIIDHSTLAKTNRNKLEAGLTGELPGEDKLASKYVIDGLIDMLNSSGRYEVIRTDVVMQKESNPEEFPQALDWMEIDKLCNKYQVDAIISLELFDSDYIIPTSMIIVKAGFRLYDPKARLIFDQNQVRQDMAWGGQVNTVAGAINRMVEKTKAIQDASYNAGYIYGKRIAPSWFQVVRQYYRKSKHDQNLKTGARMMEVNDWESAIEYLNAAVDNGKRKTKGRAAHNLAVVYEIKGDLPEAKKWAQAAWGKYGNRDSQNYAFLLGERIKEQNILEYQDGN